MKKLLMMIVLIGSPVAVLSGCGGSGPTEVEPVAEGDSSMTADQQAQYEEQMRSGAGGSSRPGN